MAFPTPLPPLFPRLTYHLSRVDSNQDSFQALIPSISPPQNHNSRQRQTSQDNKFFSDIDREELALHARVQHPEHVRAN
jgi:hypothetical protein